MGGAKQMIYQNVCIGAVLVLYINVVGTVVQYASMGYRWALNR